MGLAVTVTVVVALIFVLGTNTMESETDKYETHIKENMDTLILNEMTSTP
jgi:hypothetical protein